MSSGLDRKPISKIAEQYREDLTGSHQVLRHINYGSFAIIEVYRPAGTILPPHSHDANSICLGLAGTGFEGRERVREEIRPGTLIMRPAGQTHWDQYGKNGFRSVGLYLGPSFAGRSMTKVFARTTVLHGGLLPSLALRIYRESKIEDSATPIVVEGLLLELLGHASRDLTRPALRLPPWLKSARELCHEHFNEALNLFHIATAVGVHPTHLARSFRKHFRSTVGEYIRQLRLDWATGRLTETEESIAEIAAAAGFYDQSHFTNCFKHHTGLSPAEYRASLTKR